MDSINIYGKTKEAFGWPDDADDQLQQGVAPGTVLAGGTGIASQELPFYRYKYNFIYINIYII